MDVSAGSSKLRHRQLDEEELRPIPELIANSFVLGDTEKYIVLARVVDDLNAQGVTFFFPWDDAWAKLDNAFVARIRSPAWRAHLVDLMLFHLYQGTLPTDITDVDNEATNTTITMTNGGDVELTKAGPGVRFRPNGARVLAQSVASNGFAYMLDDVMQPAWVTESLLDVIKQASSMFPTFLELLSVANLEGLLDTQSDPNTYYTVFAPSEDAWANLTAAELEHLKGPDGLADLIELLSHHVVAGPGPVPMLFLDPPNGQPLATSLTTLANSTLAVTQHSSAMQIEGPTNSAFIIQGDAMVASNGIVHVISDVLWLPPAFCSVNPVCALLGLDGLCCNTTINGTCSKFEWCDFGFICFNTLN